MKIFALRALAGLAASTALFSAAWAYQESPMLAEMVKAGTLPPVEERLPAKPSVIEAAEVGQYGGTWNRAYKGPGDRWGPTKLLEERVVKWRSDKDGNLTLVPGYIESYAVNESSTEFTFTLLEGLKWSDGVPVTTDDVAFWYNDVFLNTDIIPTIDPTFAPGGKPMELEVVDARTFKIKFAQPYVYFLTILAKDSTGEPSLDRPSFLFPKHYLSQFNNHYAKPEELEAAAKKYGVEKWQDLWGSKGAATAWWSNPDLPVITAWKIETPAPGDVVTMVRNPYYWAVDQAGNQLPYIDRIEHRLFDQQDAFNLMIAQGQIDFQMRYANTNDFPFYMENAEKGGYHVIKWRDAQAWSLLPNLNSQDEFLNGFFGNADVRQALSLAVDRDTVNELGFAGLGEARSASPVTGSPYYNADLETHWAAYDPDAANALLDGAGFTEKDADGFRLRPDGKRITITVEGAEDNQAGILQVVADNYKDIGIELLPRIIDRTAWDDNRNNNTFDMQYYPFDRLSVVAADPRNMMGSDSYANQNFIWYSTKGASGVEPAPDAPIRQIWAAWDKASTAPTREAADAALNEMIAAFVNAGYVIGLVGETAVVGIVDNDVKNVPDGLINDDITRGEGLAVTQQIWIKE
ncbi:ABC transporter substrate-binding protein [Stagnihabitans tardus]|uniref:ABC transporter substrate-binding protein n=1 Tax=Stagnihabitans tardus TaxID=2699202 RepID=A0AAE4YB90_9RHOB|nr:ABC transporter substrate-binding protein [Stagnihabitans tardus]NBZ86475.1 ABC transporter substrate-binding protein [Stagnihabitans tardus]